VIFFPDGTTLEFNGDQVRVKAGSITGSHLAALTVALGNMAANSVDENKIVSTSFNPTVGCIVGGSGTKIKINADATYFDVSGNALILKLEGVDYTRLQKNLQYFTIEIETEIRTGLQLLNKRYFANNFQVWKVVGTCMEAAGAATHEVFVNTVSVGSFAPGVMLVDATTTPAIVPFDVNAIVAYGTDTNLVEIRTNTAAPADAVVGRMSWSLLCNYI
jgi:hypothetical protein